MRTKINIEQLKLEIRSMNRQSLLYRTLRDELTEMGFWKARERGNSKLGYQRMREKI
jgi:hypothetical protein